MNKSPCARSVVENTGQETSKQVVKDITRRMSSMFSASSFHLRRSAASSAPLRRLSGAGCRGGAPRPGRGRRPRATRRRPPRRRWGSALGRRRRRRRRRRRTRRRPRRRRRTRSWRP
ncbi:hypothetical protein SEVIR_3G166325v4 [Setaria viridis]